VQRQSEEEERRQREQVYILPFNNTYFHVYNVYDAIYNIYHVKYVIGVTTPTRRGQA
jgi:hypothetical protein